MPPLRHASSRQASTSSVEMSCFFFFFVFFPLSLPVFISLPYHTFFYFLSHPVCCFPIHFLAISLLSPTLFKLFFLLRPFWGNSLAPLISSSFFSFPFSTQHFFLIYVHMYALSKFSVESDNEFLYVITICCLIYHFGGAYILLGIVLITIFSNIVSLAHRRS